MHFTHPWQVMVPGFVQTHKCMTLLFMVAAHSDRDDALVHPNEASQAQAYGTMEAIFKRQQTGERVSEVNTKW